MCANGLRHASCTGKRAEQAAIYPLELCKAILKGITNHLATVGLMHQGCVGIMQDAEEEANFFDDYMQNDDIFNDHMQNTESMSSVTDEEISVQNDITGQNTWKKT